ncbi:beta-propeller domain-containing protein [Candidatus Contubernalis alkaliaceticus]|uniref:beta-propeller domain-containing protein n=1 Tax=Candidatus Contubernalis alkaliaceticus TaxID=338645 RepID=UPI001F4C2306|nr:beta-propeller domain-containing protein [Candidatus Contubernalis alkalaceticus]UNC93437.1 beta-propeller domain-containing protein [Candidatus Contubernalis alkalaceticus]
MNKIKKAIDSIELPEDLSRRSALGVKKAKKQMFPSKNLFRYGAIFGGLAASLLFLMVVSMDFLPLGGGLDIFRGSKVASDDNQDMVFMESAAVEESDGVGLAMVGSRENLYRLVVSGEKIYLEEVPYSNYLIIDAFDLDRPQEGVNVESLLDSSENIIMFEDRLFIEVKERTSGDLEYDEKSTTIFFFGLEGNRLVYRGRGRFPARLINSWGKHFFYPDS